MFGHSISREGKKCEHSCLLPQPHCSALRPPPRVDDKAEITALYKKLSAAMKSNNVDGYLALVTPDFKEVKITHKELKGKEAEKELRARFSAIKTVTQAEIKADSVTMTGNTAKTWTTYSFSADVIDKEGKNGPKGAKNVMAVNGKTRDTLVKTAKGWRFQQSDILKRAPTMDGQSTYRMGPRGGR